MTYGKIFTALRDATPTWVDYTNHAFVQKLGDGTLPRSAFLHYLKQDYVFLIHFSRAWSLAVIKAETLEEMRFAADTVNGLINEEIALHIKTCAKVGIDEETLFATEERQENLAYTRYVLDAGHSGDLLDLLVTLAPCVMGYGEIGARLVKTKTSETYAEWIETYAGKDYQKVCHDVGLLLDHSVERRLGNQSQTSLRWQTLCHRFQIATKLEIGFWDMSLNP